MGLEKVSVAERVSSSAQRTPSPTMQLKMDKALTDFFSFPLTPVATFVFLRLPLLYYQYSASDLPRIFCCAIFEKTQPDYSLTEAKAKQGRAV
jgi:hypothetical protein